MDTVQSLRASLGESQRLVTEFANDADQIRRLEVFSKFLVQLFEREGNLFICGNGGSHCDAMHFAEEFTGRYYKNRRPLGALALGDASHLTCVGNDFGFEHVFERQIEALGRRGDLLVGISTSGKSKNVGLAIEKAKAKGLTTVCLLGRDGGWMKGTADLDIIVPGRSPERVQEMHIKIIHSVIEATERVLFPEHYTEAYTASPTAGHRTELPV